MEPLIVDNLTVRFDAKIALDAASCRFEPGTTTALIGTNGSGKSTLLNAIVDLVEPSSGSIRRDPTARAAFVLQEHTTTHWVPLTGREVLRMGRYEARGLFGRLKADDQQIIDDAAAALDLDEALLAQPFSELSGGQQQRVLVAQALVQQPHILLLDEPITGLDIPSQRLIMDLIDAEAAAGHIVILSTHHLDEARHCDQVILLDGRIVAAGAPDEVLTPALLQEAFGDTVFDHH